MHTYPSGKPPDKQPWLRAGDADRDQVAQALQRHTAAGRLTLDEFADRVGAAHRARTVGDLAALTADLPDVPGRRRSAPRGPVLAGLVAAAVVAVLAAAGAAVQAAGVVPMDSMMAGMGAGMPGCH